MTDGDKLAIFCLFLLTNINIAGCAFSIVRNIADCAVSIVRALTGVST